MATDSVLRSELDQYESAPKDKDLHSKLLQEGMPPPELLIVGSQNPAVQNSSDKSSEASKSPEASKSGPASDSLPPLRIVDKDGGDSRKSVGLLPWEKDEDGKRQLHMNYDLQINGIVRVGEGPWHAASRILGSKAPYGDLQAFTKALGDQFMEDTRAKNLKDLPQGYELLTEDNTEKVISKITDDAIRQRVIDKLAESWTEKVPLDAVQFGPDAHGRPGETYPSRIDDPQRFLKDMTAAMEQVKADDYWRRGLCAGGFRLAVNQLPGWNVDGGSIDVSINKDIRGWRSGVQMALDLAKTGLFDVVPLKELGYQNLKQGYILGRWHYPDYVRNRPSWGGEDYGDIDVWTNRHKPADDSRNMYRDSFVLIPKGIYKKPG